MREFFRYRLLVLLIPIIIGLGACATQKYLWNHVYRNGGSLDVIEMTASYSNGIVAKNMVTDVGSQTLAGLFVEPPRWVNISWTTSDGIKHAQNISFEGRFSNIEKMSGIVIQIVDTRVEVFETDQAGPIWRGSRKIF